MKMYEKAKLISEAKESMERYKRIIESIGRFNVSGVSIAGVSFRGDFSNTILNHFSQSDVDKIASDALLNALKDKMAEQITKLKNLGAMSQQGEWL